MLIYYALIRFEIIIFPLRYDIVQFCQVDLFSLSCTDSGHFRPSTLPYRSCFSVPCDYSVLHSMHEEDENDSHEVSTFSGIVLQNEPFFQYGRDYVRVCILKNEIRSRVLLRVLFFCVTFLPFALWLLL